jgi:hypothetical protein
LPASDTENTHSRANATKNEWLSVIVTDNEARENEKRIQKNKKNEIDASLLHIVEKSLNFLCATFNNEKNIFFNLVVDCSRYHSHLSLSRFSFKK